MIKRISLILAVILALTILAGVAIAEPKLPPAPTSHIYVQDNANLIDDNIENQILSLGREVDQQTSAQLVVVSVNDLDGYTIEEYATALFRKWGLGTKEKNNGVLLLLNKENILANKSGRVRIEVGYGLEGAITDSKAGRILDDMVLPGIQSGNLSQGVYQAYQALAGEVAKEYGVRINNATKYGDSYYERAQGNEIKISPWKALLIGLLIIGFLIMDFAFFGGNITSFILGMLFAGRWGGGGGGGFGGGGFGGGSSGGGGASR